VSAMSVVSDTLTNLADVLASIGIRAAIDPRDVNPPAAWLSLDTIDVTLAGITEADGLVVLVAPDVGMPRAMDVLVDMLTTIAEHIPGVSQARPDTVSLPDHGGPLPALRFTIPLTV